MMLGQAQDMFKGNPSSPSSTPNMGLANTQAWPPTGRLSCYIYQSEYYTSPSL